MTLGDLGINLDTKRIPLEKQSRVSGIYPYYGASGIVDYINDYIFDGKYLFVSEDGANLLSRTQPIAYPIQGKNWVNNHAHVVQFKDCPTQKYVEHYLNSIDLSHHISSGAQSKLTQNQLNKIQIPVPNTSEIAFIVEHLDTSYQIINDLENGIPAEIRLRQKQYEYTVADCYRSKRCLYEERCPSYFRQLSSYRGFHRRYHSYGTFSTICCA